MFAVYRSDAGGVFADDALITDTSLAHVTRRVRALRSTAPGAVHDRLYLVHLGASDASVLARWRPAEAGYWGPVGERERHGLATPRLVAAA